MIYDSCVKINNYYCTLLTGQGLTSGIQIAVTLPVAVLFVWGKIEWIWM
jgi:hypothetical protein